MFITSWKYLHSTCPFLYNLFQLCLLSLIVFFPTNIGHETERCRIVQSKVVTKLQRFFCWKWRGLQQGTPYSLRSFQAREGLCPGTISIISCPIFVGWLAVSTVSRAPQIGNEVATAVSHTQSHLHLPMVWRRLLQGTGRVLSDPKHITCFSLLSSSAVTTGLLDSKSFYSMLLERKERS